MPTCRPRAHCSKARHAAHDVTLSQFVEAAYAALRLESSTCLASEPFLGGGPRISGGRSWRARIQPRTRVHIEVVEAAKNLTVTGKFVDVHWVLVLDTLTEKVGGFLVRKAPNFLKVTKPKEVKMSFTNADIIDVIQGIAQYGEANVIVSPKVEGTITVNFTGTPWQTALASQQ